MDANTSTVVQAHPIVTPNWAALDDLSEQADEKRRRDRIAHCGRAGKQIDLRSGTFRNVYFYCGLHLECPRCLQFRANKFREEFEKSLANGEQMVMVQLPSDQAKAMIKDAGLTREEYMRYPQEDGTDLVVVEQFNARQMNLEGQLVTSDNLDRIVWTQLASTPSGRKISGQLVSIAKPVSATAVRIRTFTMVSDAPESDQMVAITQAVLDTDYLNPTNAPELEEAIAMRTTLASNLLAELGFTVALHMEYANYDTAIDRLDWRQSAILAYQQTNPDFLFRKSLDIDEDVGARF